MATSQGHPLPIIPQPAEMVRQEGVWLYGHELRVSIADDSFAEVASHLAGELDAAGNCRTSVAGPGASAAVRIVRAAELPADGYRLTVGPDGVELAAAAPAGAFHGTQTLLQLVSGATRRRVPAVRIVDHPRFGWRGVMLDCARHFFPAATVKRYVDLAARFKLNRFHWHLTEDQGWRLPIERYPELLRVASRRRESTGDGTPHAGAFTADEIRDVVRYAQTRHVTVVPEVELPGHCAAALAACPHLSCTGGPFEVGTTWGIYRDVYCAGNDEVFAFLEGVWDEVLDLFPSPYVHIGGDEVPKDRWTACSKCRQRMRDEGLSSPEELQAWFVRRACRYLRERGRTVIGWDEVLEGDGPGGDTVIMAWRGADRGIEAARRGHRVIMTPNPSTYLNYTPYDPPRPPGHQTRRLSLETAYAFDPAPAGLDEQEAGRIIGSQACLWTEYVETQGDIDELTWPRLCALAEAAWSPPEARDWSDFQSRLAGQAPLFEQLGVARTANW